ncbi:SLAM family member 5 [Misgurnus anguillicaudatus]|uniref:SLAM family member 5 n=1 Tax=Misgurnus anguillicaudatus TaxID=75329 RepID=UPI003CCF3B3F
MFHAFIIFCISLYLTGVNTDEMKSVSVTEGESVVLNTDLTEILKDDLILWTYGAKSIHLAKINRLQKEIFKDGGVERFEERLKLNDQTGDLAITNISTDLSGLYRTEIITGNKVLKKNFTLTVYAHLPVPVISRYSSQSSSSTSSNCSLLCSVLNVRDVSLSWYKGNSLLSRISVYNIKSTASLHLEVENQDNNTYSCVLNNPITNQTQHPNITHLCQTILASESESEYVHYFGVPEVITRLVVAALVGVAAVAVVIYEIISSM